MEPNGSIPYSQHSQQPVPILSQINPVYASPFHFFTFHTDVPNSVICTYVHFLEFLEHLEFRSVNHQNMEVTSENFLFKVSPHIKITI